MKERPDTIRGLTSQALEQVGLLAQTIHPRVLDDLGPMVAPALEEIIAKSGPGLGLFMMQERASLAGATFAIDSGPATGTTVQVMLPLTMESA